MLFGNLISTIDDDGLGRQTTETSASPRQPVHDDGDRNYGAILVRSLVVLGLALSWVHAVTALESLVSARSPRRRHRTGRKGKAGWCLRKSA